MAPWWEPERGATGREFFRNRGAVMHEQSRADRWHWRMGKPGARMHRRTFLVRAGSLVIAVSGLRTVHAARSSADRVGLGTVIFRNRFEQTKPATVTELGNPLTLLNVPAYYRERFA